MKKEEAGKEDKPEQVSGEGKEAVEFAEWCADNYQRLATVWSPYYYNQKQQQSYNTQELYQLYLESKNGEPNHSK